MPPNFNIRTDLVYSPEPKRDDELMTIKEACQYLKVSRSTIYRLYYSGTLPMYRVGVGVRFKRSDVLRCVRSA